MRVSMFKKKKIKLKQIKREEPPLKSLLSVLSVSLSQTNPDPSSSFDVTAEPSCAALVLLLSDWRKMHRKAGLSRRNKPAGCVLVPVPAFPFKTCSFGSFIGDPNPNTHCV